MKQILAVLFATILLFTACKNENPVNDLPESTQTGNLAIGINKTTAPDDVTYVLATLTRANYFPVVATIQLTGASSGQATVENLDVGVWHLVVEAFGQNNVLKYSGETDVTVLAGQAVPVSLTLQYVGVNETGSVIISVNWGVVNPSDWVDSPDNPMIISMNSQYDFYSVWQPSVIVDESGYKMWYCGLANSGRTHVMYATSPDGINWDIRPEPVIAPSDSGWDANTVGVSSVLKDENGYKLYYTGWDYQYGPWYVGLAYSSDGINWERHGEPVFTGSDWCTQITASKVIKVNGLYYMFFEGRTETYYSKIGMATSTDGYNWEMINDPVLTATEAWEGAGVGYPSVIYDGTRFVMMYNSTNYDGPGFGLAFSTDGIHWQKDSTNPVFRKEWANANLNKIGYGDMVTAGDEYRMYYSGRIGDKFQIRMMSNDNL